ncbi:hypothetical protein Nstercoris_02284 (plasmid) [Nitrosomonas stercoris]|uniref:Uncharacterized protein n=1 Tax=Nitrosomonas stercoris TaxID=1444684 RepID=A0A4Y1YTA4_9PROT|nr:hypothetical protein Nstercoris_02284 [Nitrosomonas stercoris]
MSDPIALNTLYEVKRTSLEELVQAAKAEPTQIVLDELRRRCQAEADKLAGLYQLAYGKEAAQICNKNITQSFEK